MHVCVCVCRCICVCVCVCVGVCGCGYVCVLMCVCFLCVGVCMCVVCVCVYVYVWCVCVCACVLWWNIKWLDYNKSGVFCNFDLTYGIFPVVSISPPPLIFPVMKEDHKKAVYSPFYDAIWYVLWHNVVHLVAQYDTFLTQCGTFCGEIWYILWRNMIHFVA